VSPLQPAPKRAPVAKFSFNKRRVGQALLILALVGVMANGPFGSLPVYAFLAGILGFIVIYPGRLFAAIAQNWFYLLFPVLSIASTAWSDDPALTFRNSIQLMVTFIGSFVLARGLSPAAFLRVIFLFVSFMVIVSTYALPHDVPLHIPVVGIFAAKNQMGFACHQVLTAATCLLLFRGERLLLRLFALGMMGIAAVMLVLSQAAGALLYVGISLGVIVLSLAYTRVKPRLRIFVLVTVVLLIAPLVFILPTLDDYWAAFQQNVLHKDSSLTGRTYLWDFAEHLIRERPWLGHGTGAFWRQGNIDAEGLWQKFFITSRMGFNFHNIFIETLVSNGYVGLVLLVALFAISAIKILFGTIRHPTRERIFFLAYVTALYAGMSTETALIDPFYSYTVFWIAAIVYCGGPLRKPAPNLAGRPAWRMHARRMPLVLGDLAGEQGMAARLGQGGGGGPGGHRPAQDFQSGA